MRLFNRLHFWLLALVVTFAIFSKEVNAATCAVCPSGWYTCDDSKCCKGAGCPSNVYGACDAGWQYDNSTGFSCCAWSNSSGWGGQCVNAACQGCGGGNNVPNTRLTGIVYEDTNGSGSYDGNDLRWSPTAQTGCTSSKVVPNMGIWKDGGYVGTWQCNGGVSEFLTPAVVQGYDGDWYFHTGKRKSDGAIDCTGVTYSIRTCATSGCNTTNHSMDWQCRVIWHNGGADAGGRLWIKMPTTTPVARQVTGRLYVTNDPSTCSIDGNLGLAGLRTQLYSNTNAAVGPLTNVNTNNGTYSISGLNAATRFRDLAVTGTLSNATYRYDLACTTATGISCNLNQSAGTVVRCAPQNALATGNATINLGFTRTELNTEGWFTALDGDLYSQAILASIAQTPLGGFTDNLITTKTASSPGGFAFTGTDIVTDYGGTSAQGGDAQGLNTAGGSTFEDAWLNKFAFVAPENALTTIPSGRNFQAGGVYTMDVGDFNQVLQGGNYSISGAGASTKAAAIIYVLGSGTIQIDNTFVSANPANHTLLIVTDAPVEIADDIEIDPTLLTTTTPAMVDLNIVSSQDITFNSRYNASSSTYDNAIVMHGTLISRGKVDLARNLSPINNSSYPAQVIDFFPYLSKLIQEYERDNGDQQSYTGLTTVDVQFEYEN